MSNENDLEKVTINNQELGKVLVDNNGLKVKPMDMYSDIFHLGEGVLQYNGEPSGNYKANPIGYFKNDQEEKGHFRIFFDDTFEETLKELQAADFAILNGLTYFGRRNIQERASKMFAMIFDIDGVTAKTLNNFFSGANMNAYPIPNYIVLSGHGCHFYYVFEKPISLYPYTKIQLKSLKYALTDRIWNKYTSQDDKPQHQGINQGFRPAGAKTKLKGIKSQAYKVNPNKFNIMDLNQYVPPEDCIDLGKTCRESTMSFAEAEKRYTAWANWIKNGKPPGQKKYWSVKRDLYEWWKRQIAIGAAYKHRYFCIMALVIYAVKCDVSKEEAWADAMSFLDYLNSLNPDMPFTTKDLESAFECYDYRYKTFTRRDIAKLSAIPIKINRRNYQKQEWHLEDMRTKKATMKRRGQKFKSPEGRPSAEPIVKNYQRGHPEATRQEVAEATKVSYRTVCKHDPKGKRQSAEPIVQNYQKGHPKATRKEIAQATNIPYKTVYKHYKEAKEMNYNENFYTVNELVEILGKKVSKSTLQVMVRNGKIPSIAFMSKRLIPGEWVRQNLNFSLRGKSENV